MERSKRNTIDRLKPFVAIGLATLALNGCASDDQPIKSEAFKNISHVEKIVATPNIPIAPTEPDLQAKLTASMTEAVADYEAKNPGYNGQLQVAVRDRNTGKIYTYSYRTPSADNPSTVSTGTINTASTIKLTEAETLMMQNQSANLPFINPATDCDDHHEVNFPVQMTCAQLDNFLPMIENSDDQAASNIWDGLGGSNIIQNFINLAAEKSTTAEPNGEWGWSQTTALDEINIAGMLSDPASPLSPASKAIINFALDNVEPDQKWGAGAGAPLGSTVRNKNGWMPYTQQNTGWSINSVATVQNGTSLNYDIAVYSDGNATEELGIEAIEAVAAQVPKTLAPAV